MSLSSKITGLNISFDMYIGRFASN